MAVIQTLLLYRSYGVRPENEQLGRNEFLDALMMVAADVAEEADETHGAHQHEHAQVVRLGSTGLRKKLAASARYPSVVPTMTSSS